MIIKYTNFSNGIHSFKFIEPVENLGLEELFFGNVDIECKMDKSSHQIVLNCDLTLRSNLICDRCTKKYEKQLKTRFQISYIFTHEPNKTDEFNVKYLSSDEDKINIKDDVYEYAELALPIKNLCNEDCKGLCPHCGINLNKKKCNCKAELTNDVWEPLKKLWETASGKEKINN